MLSRKQIAVLHVAQNQLGLDDESYRDALEAHGGVRSAKDLGYRGFKVVMAHFEKSGFVPKGKEKRIEDQASLRFAPASRPGMATRGQIKKIYALWWALSGTWYQPGKEWKALRGFLRARFRVDHENFLKFKQAHKVIEALKGIGRRIEDREKRKEE